MCKFHNFFRAAFLPVLDIREVSGIMKNNPGKKVVPEIEKTGRKLRLSFFQEFKKGKSQEMKIAQKVAAFNCTYCDICDNLSSWTVWPG